MRTEKIKSLTYEVSEISKRTGKIVSVEFSLTFDTPNRNPYEQSCFKTIVNDLNKKAFSYSFPFSSKGILLSNFKKYTYDKQISLLNKMCNDYIGKEIKVGTIEIDEYNYRYIDYIAEIAIKINLSRGRRVVMVPTFVNMNGEIVKIYTENIDNPYELTEEGKLIEEALKHNLIKENKIIMINI